MRHISLRIIRSGHYVNALFQIVAENQGVPVHGNVGVSGVLCYHYKRSVHNGGNGAAVRIQFVRGLVQVQGVGHVDLNYIAGTPAAVNLHIRADFRIGADGLAVYFHFKALGCPVGNSQLHGEISGAVYRQFGMLRGEVGLLLYGDSHLIPGNGGGHVEIYIQGVVALGVSRRLVLHMVLHAGAVAAGKSAVVIIIVSLLARIDGQHVGGSVVHPVRGVMALRSGDLVDQGSLIVVHVLRVVRIVVVKVFGQLQHIVGRAGLAVLAPALVAQNVVALTVGILEHFAGSHAADGVGVALGDDMPEVLGYIVIVSVSGSRVLMDRSHDPRNVLVGMFALNHIHIGCQIVEPAGVVKHLGCIQESFLPGDFVQSGQGLVHAAVLAGNVHGPHFFPLFRIGASAESLVDPGADALGYLQGFLIAAVVVAVDESRGNFVQGIVGRPDGSVRRKLLQQRELVRRVCA